MAFGNIECDYDDALLGRCNYCGAFDVVGDQSKAVDGHLRVTKYQQRALCRTTRRDGQDDLNWSIVSQPAILATLLVDFNMIGAGVEYAGIVASKLNHVPLGPCRLPLRLRRKSRNLPLQYCDSSFEQFEVLLKISQDKTRPIDAYLNIGRRNLGRPSRPQSGLQRVSPDTTSPKKMAY